MKSTKICFILLVLVLLKSNGVYAIDFSGKGLKIGLNISSFHDPRAWEFVSQKRLCIGGFISFSITNIFFFQPELLFTMKGAKSKGLVADEVGPETLGKHYENYSYLELPVLVKRTILTTRKSISNLYLGPYFAIKLNSKYRRVEPHRELKGESDVSNLDYGLHIGFGTDFDINNTLTFLVEISKNSCLSGFIECCGIRLAK